MPLEIYPYLPLSDGYVQVLQNPPEDRIKEGYLDVLREPGLGVSVDEKALAPYKLFDHRDSNS